jgi:hypothetical protein
MNWITLVAAILSGLVLILATVTGYLARGVASNHQAVDRRSMALDTTEDPARRRLAELRHEAMELRNRYENTAKWSRRSAQCLSFGQYVIGGALASSFVQGFAVSKSHRRSRSTRATLGSSLPAVPT